MRLSLVTDSLSNLPLTAVLDAAAALGIEGLEVNTGNWSAAPHVDLARLLADAGARERLAADIAARGLELVALNANGNQLHPRDGARQRAVVEDTVRLAGLLGVRRVCLMSGLPGGSPDDATPNWVVTAWPPECGEILRWQWEAVLLPYWATLADHAAAHGVDELCVEMHGHQLVHGAPTLLRLRAAIGPVVCANLDPSHLFWMGADPLAVIHELGPALRHVHLKDTFVSERRRAVSGVLDPGGVEGIGDRAWRYATLGYGHDERWWREFCYRLRMVGYDGWLSIEHEDELIGREEGVERSVALMRAVMPRAAPDYRPQDIAGAPVTAP